MKRLGNLERYMKEQIQLFFKSSNEKIGEFGDTGKGEGTHPIMFESSDEEKKEDIAVNLVNFDYSPLVAQVQVLLSEHTTTTTTTTNEYVNDDYDFGNTGSILPSTSRTGNISMNHLTHNEEAHHTRTIQEEEQARDGFVTPLAAFISANAKATDNKIQHQQREVSQSRHEDYMEVEEDEPQKKLKTVQQQQVEENIDSNTSIFFNMAGGGSGSSCIDSQCCNDKISTII